MWLAAFMLLCSHTAIASPLHPFSLLSPLSPPIRPLDAGSGQQVLGPGAGRPAEPAAVAPRRLHGRFLHITDFHPDEFYQVHSSTASDAACHRGSGPAGTYGAETSDCDSPHALINATFDWIAENIRDEIDFVIWTGDNMRHDSDEELPRSAKQVLASNRMVARKFVDTFDGPAGQGLVVPVVPTLGNNDIVPHNVLLPGPNKWLKEFSDIWARFIPEEQRHSFEFGGWFYVEVVPNRLAVFSLNTLYFFDRNAGIDDCVNPSEPGYKQLEWMRVQLQFMRERGVKVILMGHVPPARTGSKQLWDETCWHKYTLWLRQYRDVVVSAFYGHMNIDHFILQNAKNINYELVGAVGEEQDAEGERDDASLESLSSSTPSTRQAMEDELDVQSTADYLQELRSEWAKLTKPPVLTTDDVESTEKSAQKGRRDGKLSRKWGEQYQLSFVSPSIVPNYFPALRVVEYDISGLEEVPLWTEGPGHVPTLPDDDHFYHETEEGKKGKDQKKGKDKKKDKKKKKPKLIVPDGPSKTAALGPAYSAQPLSLLGYTQYFANLTHLNNDLTVDDPDADMEAAKWRNGKHNGKDPKSKPAKPRKFQFEVEYSTFTDKIYGLSDLTVNSFLDMAYRMGKKSEGKATLSAEDIYEEDEEGDEEEEDVLKAKKGKKDKKKKKKKKQNKVWLHFLKHAFVASVDKKELKKIAE